jgi:hypothetical protein
MLFKKSIQLMNQAAHIELMTVREFHRSQLVVRIFPGSVVIAAERQGLPVVSLLTQPPRPKMRRLNGCWTPANRARQSADEAQVVHVPTGR